MCFDPSLPLTSHYRRVKTPTENRFLRTSVEIPVPWKNPTPTPQEDRGANFEGSPDAVLHVSPIHPWRPHSHGRTGAAWESSSKPGSLALDPHSGWCCSGACRRICYITTKQLSSSSLSSAEPSPRGTRMPQATAPFLLTPCDGVYMRLRLHHKP